MNKKLKTYVIIWTIIFAVFNVICFVTPNEAAGMTKFGGAFWAGYIFIDLAFIGQLICTYFALKAETLKKMFYNIPLIMFSFTGLILMLIFGAAAMAIPNLPNWAGIVICLLILAFTAIAVIKAKASSDIVEKVDDKIKEQTQFIKTLTVEAENLLEHAKSDSVKTECKKIYEDIRYSDPVSTRLLSSVESQITVKFSALSDAVAADDAEIVRTAAGELAILIAERNKKCRLLK